MLLLRLCNNNNNNNYYYCYHYDYDPSSIKISEPSRPKYVCPHTFGRLMLGACVRCPVVLWPQGGASFAQGQIVQHPNSSPSCAAAGRRGGRAVGPSCRAESPGLWQTLWSLRSPRRVREYWENATVCTWTANTVKSTNVDHECVLSPKQARLCNGTILSGPTRGEVLAESDWVFGGQLSVSAAWQASSSSHGTHCIQSNVDR